MEASKQAEAKKKLRSVAAKAAGTGGPSAALAAGRSRPGRASRFAHGAGAEARAPALDIFSLAGDIFLPASRSVLHLRPPVYRGSRMIST